jgi:hypothetical protein
MAAHVMKRKLISYEKPNLTNLEALIQSLKVTKYEKQALKSYRDKIDEVTGMVKVEYEAECFGRYIGVARKGKEKTYTAGYSMKREHRNLLFADAYDDLDISNSSGNIMCQIFEKHGLPTEKFRHLCDHREEILKEIATFYPTFPLERITAKDVIIEVLFCGSGENSLYWELSPYMKRHDLPQIVKELKEEYHRNLTVIIGLPEYKELHDYELVKAKEKDKEAWIGMFASILYRNEESKVLESLYNGISEEGVRRRIQYATGSLIHDGLHIIQPMKIQEGNLIKRLEAKALADTGYMVTLEIKSMRMTDEEKKEWLGDPSVSHSYEARRAEFERTRFKCKNQFFTIGMEGGIEELHTYDKTAFTILNEDAFVGAVDYLKEWYVDPQKRSYVEVEYGCVKEKNQHPHIYYAFPALRYKLLSSMSSPTEKDTHIAFFQEYISSLMEDHPIYTNLPQQPNETTYTYMARVESEKYCKWLTLWCADIICNPDKKNAQPIACIFWGKQGSGKTMLRVLMERLLGERVVHNTSDPTKNGDILHDFNKALKNKLFIECSEINLKITSSVTDKLKDLITNTTHEIRQMRTDLLRVNGSERMIFTTNHAGSVVIEKGDRRFMAVSVSQKNVGNSAYWTRFASYLKNDDFIRDIADYLLSFEEEVERFSFRDERPLTDYYKRLQCMSLPPELDFLKDLFFYEIEKIEKCKEDMVYFIPTTPLLTLYNTWRENHSLREKISVKTFVLKLKSLGTEYGITHKKEMSANGFTIDHVILKEALIKDFDIVADT